MIDVEIGHDNKFHINYAVPKIMTSVLYYVHIMYKYCYYTALYNVHFSQDNI